MVKFLFQSPGIRNAGFTYNICLYLCVKRFNYIQITRVFVNNHNRDQEGRYRKNTIPSVFRIGKSIG